MMRSAMLLASLSLAGCSSMLSVPVTATSAATAGDGLVYYLPRRDVLITFTVAEKGQRPTVEIAASASYADPNEVYVLRYQRNAIGENAIDIGINTSGLLNNAAKSTSSNQLSQIAEAFSALKAARAATALPANLDDCLDVGVHRYSVDLTKDLVPITDKSGNPNGNFSLGKTLCGKNFPVGVVVEKLWSSASAANGIRAVACGGAPCNGLYYRQNRPYRVTLTAPGVTATQVVESPSESGTLFLPMAATVFAGSEASFTFEDGVPTHYAQKADGEAIALLKLPAQLLKAYFEAVGGILSATKDNKTAQAEKVGAELKLELAKRQYSICLAAIGAGASAEELKGLGCMAN